MAGPGAPASGGGNFPAADRMSDQAMGDLAAATELYLRRLIDFLELRILLLGESNPQASSQLAGAKAAAELGLRASERLIETLARTPSRSGNQPG